MLQRKPLSEISGADIGWLKARHHFSFGQFGNPTHKPVGNLIVFNDDEVAPGQGFGLHPHADLEIVSYIRQGVVTHRDDRGNLGTTEAGDVQVMSAGSGIRHSEHNEGDLPVKLFQIWLKPRRPGGEPRWGNRPFPKSDRAGAFVTLASGRDAIGALPIRSDAEVSGAMLLAGTELDYSFKDNDAGYLVTARGNVEVNGIRLEENEGLVITNERAINIKALDEAELVLVTTAV